MRMEPSLARSSHGGQALVEFAVGLVALLILIAALVQIGAIARRDLRNILDARARAGAAALSDVYLAPVLPGPRFIRDWSDGPDGSPYTRDDRPIFANPNLLAEGIVGRVDPDRLSRLVPQNRFSALADPAAVLPGMGFVRGSSSRTVIPVLPIARRLFFGRETLELDSDVFLIWTKGVE
jgi:hypothetical protein